MGNVAVNEMAEQISVLLERNMNVGGRGLSAKLRRAGWRLPRAVRKAAWRIAVANEIERGRIASKRQKVPHLMGPLSADYQFCLHYLSKIDPAHRTRTAIIGFVVSAAKGLSGVAILLGVAWLSRMI